MKKVTFYVALAVGLVLVMIIANALMVTAQEPWVPGEEATAQPVQPEATEPAPWQPAEEAPAPEAAPVEAAPVESAAGVGAQNLPGSGWWTGMQIQNVDPAQGTASIVFTAYDKQGGAGSSYQCGSGITLTYGASFVYVPTDQWGITPNCGNLGNDMYSAVVSADKQIVAFVEETNQPASPLGVAGGAASGSYRGLDGSQTATTLLFPLYKNGHYGESSTFFIQNAGSGNATITAVFKGCTNTAYGCPASATTYTYTVSGVEPNRTVIINPGDAKDASNTAMPSGNGRFGGLTVTSDQKLAGVMNEHKNDTATATYLKATRAFVPSEFDTTVYAPVLKQLFPAGDSTTNHLVKWSALQIQNAETATSVNIVVTYTVATQTQAGTAGTQYVDNTTCTNIGPGETCFLLLHEGLSTGGTDNIIDGMLLSAMASANGNIVATVNAESDYNYGGAENKQYSTYSCIPDNAKATKLSFPGYKEHWYGRFTGVSVMNVGTAGAAYTATVQNANAINSPPSADLVVRTTSDVAVNQAHTFLLLSEGQTANVTTVSGTASEFKKTNNSMVVESTQPVVGVATQEDTYMTWMPDYVPANKIDGSDYEGFPIQ